MVFADHGRDGGPDAFIDGKGGVAGKGVMEFGFGEWGDAGDGGGDGVVFDGGQVGDFRKGFGGAQMEGVVDIEADFLGRPAGFVAVGHVDLDADVFGGGDGVVAFHVAVEGIGKIVGAVDEEGGDLALFEPAAGIVEFDPACGLVWANAFEVFKPGAVFIEESATINGDGGFESGVDGRDNAGGVAAPGNAGDGGAGFVHFG